MRRPDASGLGAEPYIFQKNVYSQIFCEKTLIPSRRCIAIFVVATALKTWVAVGMPNVMGGPGYA